jgi:hypothetical protein
LHLILASHVILRRKFTKPLPWHIKISKFAMHPKNSETLSCISDVMNSPSAWQILDTFQAVLAKTVLEYLAAEISCLKVARAVADPGAT